MALPKIDLPTYKTIIPSTDREILFKPFTVKENKILLLAYESESPDEVITAVKQIVNNCVVSELDVNRLAMFDLEYLILQMRIRSISDVVDLSFTLDGENCCEVCKNPIQYQLDLKEVKVEFPENSSPKIAINDQVGLIMAYPSFDLLNEFAKMDLQEEDEANIANIVPIIAKCIKMIYTNDKMIDPRDEPVEEVYEWIESLSNDIFTKIIEFFNQSPKLKHSFDVKCPSCENKKTVELEGLLSFFG